MFQLAVEQHTHYRDVVPFCADEYLSDQKFAHKERKRKKLIEASVYDAFFVVVVNVKLTSPPPHPTPSSLTDFCLVILVMRHSCSNMWQNQCTATC